MKANFSCQFEREEKGVFMEADTDSYENLVGFTFYNGFEVEGEVCLNEKQVQTLIEMLQKNL